MGKLNTLHEGDNIGGLLRIQIALASDFETFAPIRFKQGKQWQDIDIYPDSGLFKSDVQHGDNGRYYTYAGNFKIHHPNRKDENSIDAFIGPVSIMRITDHNKYTQVIGTPDEPVTLARSLDTGTKPTDLSHNAFTFSVSQLYPALS